MSIYENARKKKAVVAAEKMEQTAEDASREELTELQQGFRDRLKNEEKRRKATTDSEFWFAVCFKSREDKEDFLKRWKLFNHGDKYLSGPVVNKVLTNLIGGDTDERADEEQTADFK